MLGFKDVTRAPRVSLSYGVVMASVIMAASILVWQGSSTWVMLLLLVGLVFFAPIACVGIYAISAQLERDIPVSLVRTLRACLKRYIGTELVFVLALIIVFLVWARASSMTSIFMPNRGDYGWADLSAYLAIMSLVSVFFLGITFAASVFALPMIMHRDVDAITAIVTSINAVLRNKLAMLVWGLLIGCGLLLGLASAGIFLVVFLPAVGHAVWHGYLETIDASQFPRHVAGITATARAAKER
ncbi:DUF2189 domain-containing protein [Arenicella xantha]|nr:DUF2189 domain-containing protein [Arenicella xantha]